MKSLHINLDWPSASLAAAIFAALGGAPRAEAARAPEDLRALAVVDAPYICRPVSAEGLRPVVVWIEGEVLVVGSMRKADPLPAWMAANGAGEWRTPVRPGVGVMHQGGRLTLKLAGRTLDCQRTNED
jgi:hypothetical protein